MGGSDDEDKARQAGLGQLADAVREHDDDREDEELSEDEDEAVDQDEAGEQELAVADIGTNGEVEGMIAVLLQQLLLTTMQVAKEQVCTPCRGNMLWSLCISHALALAVLHCISKCGSGPLHSRTECNNSGCSDCTYTRALSWYNEGIWPQTYKTGSMP